MIFLSFVVGMIVGSVLSSVALLLAIGITSQRDDETYMQPVNVAMHHPPEIPHAAIGSWWPTCPDCGREASYSIKRLDSPVPIGYGCEAHGEFR